MTSIFILLFFITSRILLNSLWEQVSVYYSYLYEVLFILIVIFLKRSKRSLSFKFEFSKENIFRIVPWPFLGFIFYRLANHSGITIPFDFKSLELVIMLLVIAPILEEFIFRFAIWELFDDVVKNKEVQIWFSAAMFSLSHFMAIYMISPDLRPFVLYQSLYVIILGIGSSKMRQESNGMTGSILVHFLFNLGFYFASLV